MGVRKLISGLQPLSRVEWLPAGTDNNVCTVIIDICIFIVPRPGTLLIYLMTSPCIYQLADETGRPRTF